MSKISRFYRALGALGLLLAGSSLCLAAGQPPMPQTIKLIVGYPPGGSVDTVARLLAQPLAENLGANVIVENRPGAGGRIAAGIVKHSPPDGSVVMIAPNALTTIQTLVYAKTLGYDMRKDFVPVSRLIAYPIALSVSAASPIKTPADLAAWLKAHPGQANYGSSSAGGMSHFAGLMYAKAAGVQWTHVAFKGGAPLLNAILGGHVVAGIDTLIDHIEYHRTGKLRILGIFTPKRYRLAPEVPTLEEQGIKGLDVQGWFGAYAPAGTPQETVRRLDEAIGKALSDPPFVDRLNKLVIESAYLPSAEFTRLQEAELRQWAPVIRDSGFNPEQ
ncbi:Bug family tripartite tricarboxylate transporter substrate binding protein [Bordetella petrii]|uniref:Bug family tripartite tricarboxylate transporter substrate binding protein n=1 Tax=Bordetella petrii TaxID=94624 RepID=UPI001A974D4F|nr:Bug family tripartite tricarboxylate transporter substrate binding protein [Bordetella petrii]MBO1114041.1 Bug family tripartite tricarboxylate transporter substrate binding protein [Bordetella petrii]